MYGQPHEVEEFHSGFPSGFYGPLVRFVEVLLCEGLSRGDFALPVFSHKQTGPGLFLAQAPACDKGRTLCVNAVCLSNRRGLGSPVKGFLVCVSKSLSDKWLRSIELTSR